MSFSIVHYVYCIQAEKYGRIIHLSCILLTLVLSATSQLTCVIYCYRSMHFYCNVLSSTNNTIFKLIAIPHASLYIRMNISDFIAHIYVPYCVQ